MLIYIDRTIGEHGIQFGLTMEEKCLFAELALSRLHGNCMLFGELSTVDWLQKNLGGIEASVYADIRGKHSYLPSAVSLVETLLVISYSKPPCVPDFMEGKYHSLAVSEATDYTLNGKCVLLAENLTDCKFYSLLAERYIFDKNIRGISLAIQAQPGGGGTISSVFEHSVLFNKTPILCFVDSDFKYGSTKRFPGPPAIGNTAKQLIAVKKHLDVTSSGVYELYCLPAHEIENLIPINVLEAIAKDCVPTMKSGIEQLKLLLRKGLSESILLYDFKNGQTLGDGSPRAAYWDEIGSECGINHFHPLCSKILEKAVEHLSEGPHPGSQTITLIPIDDYLLPLWGEIGHKVFSWSCAQQPKRS